MHSKTIHASYLGENSAKLTQMLQQDPSSGSNYVSQNIAGLCDAYSHS